MTAAERYRQLEISPSVQVARWIFNNRLNNAPKIPLREVVEDIKTGKTPSKNEKKYYENGVLDWFKPSEIGEGKYLTSAKDKLSKLAVDTKQATIYQPGTLLITAIGDIGRLAITTDVASSNQQITGIAFNKQVMPEYAYYYFLAFRAFFYTDVSQTTLPIVNQKKITSIPFILCSVEEQKSTVDFLSTIELIKLPQDVEQLDSLTSDRELLAVAIGIFAVHFASASLVAEFNEQELHLTHLRQALLREAMQGQLLPQDPTDEPAALLLKKLQAAKAATGKGAKGKAGALFAEEAGAVKGLFSTPKDWLWCSLNQIASVSSGSTPKPDAFIEKGGVPYLKMYNLVNQNVGFDYRPQYIKEEVHNSLLKRSIARPGDLLMNIVGPPLGKLAIVPETFPEWNMNQAIVMITSSEKTTNKWIYWFLREGSAIATVELKGMAGQDNISVNQTRAFPIPLPPLAEQHRIVAKLEQLMQHCDALEQRIRESRRLAEQLLQTALREALAPPAGAEVAAEEITPEPHPRTHRGGAQLALTDLFE